MKRPVCRPTTSAHPDLTVEVPRKTKEVIIDDSNPASSTVIGDSLTLEFRDLMLREPVGRESDVILVPLIYQISQIPSGPTINPH
jgi:hypothetical protein